MRYKKQVVMLIGILLFVYILIKLNLRESIIILLRSDLRLIFIVLLMRILYILVKSLGWRYLLKIKGIEYPVKDSFMVYSIGLFLGLVTPARIGDFIKVMYLKKDGYEFKKTFVTVFVDRTIDLSFLLITGYLSMLFFMQYFNSVVHLLTLAMIAVAALVIIMLFYMKYIKKISVILINKLIPEKYKRMVNVNITEVYNELRVISKKEILIASMIIISAWLIYFIQMYIAAIALKIPLSLFQVIVIISISGLVTLIPVSISGIGTRDAVIILLFSIIGISREAALSYSLLYLFLMIFAAFIGFIAWIRKPIRII